MKNKFKIYLGLALALLFFIFLINNDHSSSYKLYSNCKNQINQQQCWEETLEDTFKSEGLNRAFETLADLYVAEPAFAAECHGFAHKLGQAAYEKFHQDKKIELSSRSSYCGYGFYHGFMEVLLYGGGTVKEAQEFCAYAGEELKNQTSDAEGACYHGIGHGAVDGSDPRAWGDPQATIEPGLKLCQMVASDKQEPFGKLYRCVSGAYNSLEILANDKKYKLDFINTEPFSFCSSQPAFNLEACYTNMLPALWRDSRIDFEKLSKLIEAIEEPNDAYIIRPQVTLALFHEYIRENLDKPDFNVAQGVNLCRRLNSRAYFPCIQGLSGGHMKYGEPTKEYIKALAFCGSSVLTGQEKETCHEYVLSILRIWYTYDKVIDICNQVRTEYRHYCNEI